MLGRVEEECVNNSVLSQYVLSNKFGEYEGLYQNVLDYEFVKETTIFTGYDTLPGWKEARSGFVKKYNQMGERYKQV